MYCVSQEGISYRSVDIGDDKSGISGDDGDSQFPGMREHRNGRTPSDDMSPTKFPYHVRVLCNIVNIMLANS